MDDSQQHSRRDFLQGKAAAKTLLDKAQSWIDQKVDLLAGTIGSDSAVHLNAKRRLMACDFIVQFHESDAEMMDSLLEAFDRVEALESQLTIYRETSEVLEINRQAAHGPVPVGSELWELLDLSARIHRDTKGAFDITSTPLSQVWGFLKRQGRVPNEDELEEARSNTGFGKIDLDANSGSIHFHEPGVEINFNSMGKGYALDCVAQELNDQGVCDYLWHAGGSSVLARGRNHSDAKEAWSLGLRHPFQPTRRILELHLRDQALGTAGGATQFFEYEGNRYSHILDPRTGQPAEGVLSATVIAPLAAEADALATAFFVMGVEEVAQYCQIHPEIQAILLCPDAVEEGYTMHSFNMKPESWTKLEE